MEQHGYPSYSARSPAWEELESGKMAGAESGMSGAGIPQQPQPQASAAAGPADESSDSEGEHEGPQKLIRKVSTSGQIRSKVCEHDIPASSYQLLQDGEIFSIGGLRTNAKPEVLRQDVDSGMQTKQLQNLLGYLLRE